MDSRDHPKAPERLEESAEAEDQQRAKAHHHAEIGGRDHAPAGLEVRRNGCGLAPLGLNLERSHVRQFAFRLPGELLQTAHGHRSNQSSDCKN